MSIKLLTNTNALRAMGGIEAIPDGIISHSGRWAIVRRPSGSIEALHWRCAFDSSWGETLAVVLV